jgi:hypothetical protein
MSSGFSAEEAVARRGFEIPFPGLAQPVEMPGYASLFVQIRNPIL